MPSFFNSNLAEYLTEYADDTDKPKFTGPFIYHGGPNYDLSKRWYVYYSFRNPSTGKLVRQPTIFKHINRDYKTKKARLKNLNLLKIAVQKMLEDGYNPYESHVAPTTQKNYTAVSCIDFVFDLKLSELSQTSKKDYKNRVDRFKQYLVKHSLDKVPIQQITRQVIVDFLNGILKASSPRNRNNTKIVLSSLFTSMVANGLIEYNFIKDIDKLKAAPRKNRIYSADKVDEIFSYLDEKHPVLALFIRVFSFNFLRPVEACRIRCGDVDMKGRMISFKAKNKPLKHKIIPDIVFAELEKLDLSHPDHFLFTPTGPGPWDATEVHRRDHFTHLFADVKNELVIGSDYTMYSFRHFFITRLYRHFRKSFSKTETMDKLQLVTGHESRDGLMNYLRSIDAEMPEDWSDGIAF